ncbi:hypothetical protein [Actinoplanes sp. NPDC049118]|uniref:hypothetical protein n=1 Tax=Actinoplanes sp. NPDC049118 TaxID=3155769 RepID=UPI003410F321
MRFFSNDAREADEELALDDRPERVQSDPVAVPNQRPPSPWSNTPATTGDAVDDADRARSDDEPRDDTADPADGTVNDDDTTGDPDRTTAFGASSARDNDRWGAPGSDPDDSAVTTADRPYAGSPAATGPEDTWLEDEDRVDAHDHGGPTDEVDVPLDDEPAAGEAPADTEAAQAKSGKGDSEKAESESDEDRTEDEDKVDGPEAVETVTDEPRDDADTETSPASDKTDDTEAVAPVTDAPLATDDTPAADEPAVDGTEPAVVPVPVPVPVGAAATASAAKAETIFGADDAKSFQERWREVQLRFVDSPKDAAAEATTLIDEAVEKLTAGLKAQRDDLTDDTEDTERLRLQLRGYRDILNRILSL